MIARISTQSCGPGADPAVDSDLDPGIGPGAGEGAGPGVDPGPAVFERRGRISLPKSSSTSRGGPETLVREGGGLDRAQTTALTGSKMRDECGQGIQKVYSASGTSGIHGRTYC